MKKDAMEIIQTRMNYKFHNIELLKQAFSRSENDVLEFYGDRILSFVLVNEFSRKYGYIAKDKRFVSTKSTRTLSQTLTKYVMNKNLADRMEKIGFADFYRQFENTIYCWKDIADLFEAIIGAVAIDSNWNVNIICDVVLKLLKGFILYPKQPKDSIYPGRWNTYSNVSYQKNGVNISGQYLLRKNDTPMHATGFIDLESCRKVINKKSDIFDQLGELVAYGLIEKPSFCYSIDHERGESITCTKCELSFPNIDRVFCGYQDDQKKLKLMP